MPSLFYHPLFLAMLFNTLIGICMMEWSMRSIEKIRANKDLDKINALYPEFARLDLGKLKKSRMIWLTPIILPKYLICWAGWGLLYIWIKVVVFFRGS